MATALEIKDWASYTWHIVWSDVTEIGIDDQLVIANYSTSRQEVVISQIGCPGRATTNHTPPHTGTGWVSTSGSNVIFSATSSGDVLAEGTTRHGTPLKVEIESAVDKNGHHELTCRKQGGGPGGVCWVANDG